MKFSIAAKISNMETFLEKDSLKWLKGCNEIGFLLLLLLFFLIYNIKNTNFGSSQTCLCHWRPDKQSVDNIYGVTLIQFFPQDTYYIISTLVHLLSGYPIGFYTAIDTL